VISRDISPALDWKIHIERRISWTDLERLQGESVRDVDGERTRAHLICSEPLPTFTAGISARAEDVLWSHETQTQRGVTRYPARRGGQWTYHGPGQIVLFPIVRLDAFGYHRRAVHRFMGDLRAWVADYLNTLNLVTELRDRPFGIYVNQKKLVSFGMAVQRGISSQGLALYHSDQSDYFQGIRPCGVSTGSVTSLGELGVRHSWDTVAFQIIETVKKGLKIKKKSLGC
jgi:lipoyl(octanoyl) transferase